MVEVVYKNRIYILVVVAYISFLLIKNGVKVIVMQDLYGAAVMTVQAIVLYQIYLKHTYVKIGIKTWTFFPIVKEGTLLTVNFLYLISGGTENIELEGTLKSAFFFLAAILIHLSCDRYIKINKKDYV